MKLNLTRSRKYMLTAATVGLIGLAAWPALATIMVTPMIVLMEGRTRYADVNLVNTTQTTQNYSLDWKYLRMAEGTGLYENMEASITPFDLAQNMVLTPRRVTIEPMGMQKVRLGLRLKGEPPAPGDYRAHLEMAQGEKPVPADASAELKENEVKVGVAVRVGFSIPVIYRVGESDAVAKIGDITKQFNEKLKKNELVIPITRSGGPFGFYGNLTVKKGNAVLGEIRNANIFPEVSERKFIVVLNEDAPAGSIQVVFKHHDTKNETVFAQKTF